MYPVVKCGIRITRRSQHKCKLEDAHHDGADETERLANIRYLHEAPISSQVSEIKNADHIYPYSKAHFQCPDYRDRQGPKANVSKNVTCYSKLAWTHVKYMSIC